jgi:hypothetical protein
MAIKKKNPRAVLEPFWSYKQNSSANSAHLPQKWAKSFKLKFIAT